MANLKGIDVSAHQGLIVWPLVAERGGIDFVWIKATEGTTRIDEAFVANWGGALFATESGIKRGAYHFARSGSGRAQAEHFLRIYPGAGELPPALDLERAPDGSVPSIGEALVWLEIVGRETGVRPMVYISPGFADEIGAGGFSELGEADLWLAHHGVIAPRVPRPWTDWRAWQTGIGGVPGVRGPIDLDVMRAW